jgi:hypothetical protein
MKDVEYVWIEVPTRWVNAHRAIVDVHFNGVKVVTEAERVHIDDLGCELSNVKCAKGSEGTTLRFYMECFALVRNDWNA